MEVGGQPEHQEQLCHFYIRYQHASASTSCGPLRVHVEENHRLLCMHNLHVGGPHTLLPQGRALQTLELHQFTTFNDHERPQHRHKSHQNRVRSRKDTREDGPGQDHPSSRPAQLALAKATQHLATKHVSRQAVCQWQKRWRQVKGLQHCAGWPGASKGHAADS